MKPEEAFMQQILEAAKLFGWRSAHFRPAMTMKGPRTAVGGDGKGFPDLLLIRGKRMIVAELKCGKNQPSEEQKRWLAAFDDLPEVVVVCWRPEMWDEIVAELRKEK